MCIHARTHNNMTDYNVLIRIAESKGLTEFDDLLYLANVVDTEIQKATPKK